uniref:Secreted protein n=1 Tax=Panagrellus redivivus TaxID=6233 RepID=A0A7E4W8U5_PANRE
MFVTMAFIMSMHAQGITLPILFKMIRCQVYRNQERAVSPNQVRNIFGKTILNTHNAEGHFDTLKKSWDNAYNA